MGYGKVKTITTDHTTIPVPKCKEHNWNIFQHYKKNSPELNYLDRVCRRCYKWESCKIVWKKAKLVTYIFGDGTIKKQSQKGRKK